MIKNVDPRIKIIYSIIISLTLVFINKISLLFLSIVIFLFLNLLNKIGIKEFLKKILFFNLFLLFFVILLPFSFPNKSAGLELSLKIVLRSNAMILSILALLSDASFLDFFYALERLKFPKKFASLLFLIYRYIFSMEKELKKIQDGLKIRNFEKKTNLFTYRTYGYVIGTLFLRGYQYSENLYYAMILKGFRGHFSILKELSIRKRDIIFSFFLTLYLLFIIYFQWKKF